MKRIIIGRKLFSVLILSTFTVFFTGCNGGSDPDYFDIPVIDQSEVEIEIETLPIYDMEDASSEALVKRETVVFESQMNQGDLDQKTEESRDTRFDDVNGKRAFWFPEDHPADRDSLKQFKVLGLLNGTFYYFYITRPEGSDTEIHAVARYHYRDGVGKLLHERSVKVKADDAVSTEFHAQVFKIEGGYRICIYDDGNLILLNNMGETIFSFTDKAGGKNMRDIVRSVFDVGGEYYDVDITDVFTDGSNTFYIPLTLIKEDYTELEDFEDDITTVSHLFVYTYLPVNNKTEMIYRDNLNLSLQEAQFQKLADAGGLRDPEEDWKTATELYPDRWGDYYLGKLTGGKIEKEGYVWQWNGPFNSIYSFNEAMEAGIYPVKDSVKPMKPISIGSPLPNAVVLKKSPPSLCDMYGVAEKQFVVKKTLRRSYSYQEEVMKTDAEGKEYKEYVTKEVSDSVEANWQNKITLSEGTFLNDYAVKFPNNGVDVARGPAGRDGSFRFGYVMGNTCLLADAGGDAFGSRITFPEIKDGDYHISMLNTVGGSSYVGASDLTNNRIYFNVYNPGDLSQARAVVLNTEDLASKYRKGKGDDELFDKMEEIGKEDDTKFDFSDTQVQDNPSVYSGDNMVVMGKQGEESFLLTSFHNGMQLYQPSSQGPAGSASTPGTVWQISDWPIYQAWPVSESKVTAIGFDRTDTVYESMDIAMARVYTFDVNEIKKTAPFHTVPLKTADRE